MTRPAADSTEVLVIDLKPFCAVNDIRTYLNAPFVVDGHTIATNGHVLIRVPGADHGADPSLPVQVQSSIRKMFQSEDADFIPLPALPDPQKCPLCNGTGFIENADCDDCDGLGSFEHGRHEYDCEECNGTGKIDRAVCRDRLCNGGFVRDVVKIGDAQFDARYLRLIAALPNARICTDGPQGTAAFVFDGGDGRLMPMRSQ